MVLLALRKLLTFFNLLIFSYNSASNSLIGTLFSSKGTAQIMTYTVLTSGFSVVSNSSYVSNTTQYKYCGASSPLGALDQSSSTYATMCCSDSDGCDAGAVIQSVNLANGSALSSTGYINWVNEVQFGLYWITSS